jgi:hypothetical protein
VERFKQVVRWEQDLSPTHPKNIFFPLSYLPHPLRVFFGNHIPASFHLNATIGLDCHRAAKQTTYAGVSAENSA